MLKFWKKNKNNDKEELKQYREEIEKDIDTHPIIPELTLAQQFNQYANEYLQNKYDEWITQNQKTLDNIITKAKNEAANGRFESKQNVLITKNGNSIEYYTKYFTNLGFDVNLSENAQTTLIISQYTLKISWDNKL